MPEVASLPKMAPVFEERFEPTALLEKEASWWKAKEVEGEVWVSWKIQGCVAGRKLEERVV